jgi:hypothetical protein
VPTELVTTPSLSRLTGGQSSVTDQGRSSASARRGPADGWCGGLSGPDDQRSQLAVWPAERHCALRCAAPPRSRQKPRGRPWILQTRPDFLPSANRIVIDMTDRSEARGGWRRRMLVAGSPALLVLLALGGEGAAAGSRQVLAKYPIASRVVAVRHEVGLGGPSRRPLRRTSVIHVASGSVRKQFAVSEPAGVIRLLRLTLPRGTRANLTGVIPQVAGIGMSVPQRNMPSENCRRGGSVEVCTQAEEACPMPAAKWQFQLHKLAGPAGEVRLEFVVS